MKKSMKKILACALVSALAGAWAFPSLAANIVSTKQGSVTNYIKTDNYKKYENYPCWIWYQGYCYYYASADNYLKNTTTPDGYTVDELGRWTVNGNPVHNGAGNYKMGTEDYNGKSDDEIWELMKEKLIPVYETVIACPDYDGPDANGRHIHIDSYTYGYGNDIIWMNKDTSTYGGYGETGIIHNDVSSGTYLTVWIGNDWSDLESITNDSILKAAYSQIPDIKEKTIKAAVGDKIGTELFNYIKQHANKIWHDDYWNPNDKADGIMPDKLDLSAWKDKTTDYGKKFSVDNSDGFCIKIYK